MKEREREKKFITEHENQRIKLIFGGTDYCNGHCTSLASGTHDDW